MQAAPQDSSCSQSGICSPAGLRRHDQLRRLMGEVVLLLDLEPAGHRDCRRAGSLQQRREARRAARPPNWTKRHGVELAVIGRARGDLRIR